MAQFLWAWEPFDSMKARHLKLMEKYPNTPTKRGEPFGGMDLLTKS
jgi:arylsulfatase